MQTYCIELYKHAINIRVLLATLSNKPSLRLFHRTTNNFMRKGILKCSINPEHENFEKNVDQLNKQNSNTNFFGIESDEGVIIIDKRKGSVNSFIPSDMKIKSKEKFLSTSFGIIRHDIDNKIRFHGQYQNSVDSVDFPHKSTENSEVQRDNKYVKYSSMYNDSNDSCRIDSNCKQKLSKESFTEYDSNINASWSNAEIERLNCNLNVYEKENKDINDTDECFIEDMTEKDNSDKDSDLGYPIHELNYVDEYYFGNGLVSQIHKANSQNNVPDNFDKDLSYLDEQFFGNYPSREHDKVNLQNCVPDKKLDVNIKQSQNAPGDDTSFIDESVFHSSDKINTSIKNNPCIVSKDAVYKHLLDENSFEVTSNLNAVSRQLGSRQNDDNSDISMSPHLPDKKSENASKYPSTREKSKVYDKNSQLLETIKPTITGTDLSSSRLDSGEADSGDILTAHDFVKKLHKEQEVKNTGIKTGTTSPKSEKVDSKGFRILKNQVPDLSHFTREEIINNLKSNILYSDDDLLILNKPYSLIVHESKTTKYPCLSSFLDDLAKETDRNSKDPKLLTVHRLDKETTGCLLLARNETMAQNLKSLFAERKIIKKYWIVTSKVPELLEGVIDIPITEGSVGNKKRMVLHPHLTNDIVYRNHSKSGKQAVTSYKVLSVSGNAALVEITPETGIKHQIRVHFGFGLSCPILGDHKYSHLQKLAPQKLPSDILQRLHVRQSKVRYIPMHIHARSITIPEYLDGRNLFIMAPLPQHMRINLKRLKFRKKK